MAEGYKAETEGFADLGMTSESKALKSIFFGQVWCSWLVYLVGPGTRTVVMCAYLACRMSARKIDLANRQETLITLLSLEQV